jgi:hypothetical protein
MKKFLTESYVNLLTVGKFSDYICQFNGCGNVHGRIGNYVKKDPAH